ncbi:MAG: 50S ribosomal protein L25/general stress protein Ctc [Actinomycetia bacterium]|nr:50S ribosomal protein L25/general stress protein Ctc [Actinomycetes bacterium]
MTDLTLNAEKRTNFGKGAARKIRRDHKIPAVMYGHGAEPIHITLPGHDTMMALKNPNALLTIVLEGDEQMALAKDVQRDPIKPVIEHVDLVIVRKGEKVTVDVPVHLEGQAGAETVVNLDSPTIQLEAEATHIPESITVSIEGLEAGSQIHAKDLVLPEGSSLIADEELLVVNITQMISEEALEAELAEAEAEAGIEADEPEAAGDEAAAEGEEAPEAPAEGGEETE